MNRAHRRYAGKGQDDQRLVLVGFVAQFENGQHTNLDIRKIQVIDRETGRSLFDEVLEAPVDEEVAVPKTPRQEFDGEPDKQSYTVEFDTPEGKMEYVKKGNWSGVRKAQ